MSWYSRWRNVFRSEHLNNELDAEFQYHLEQTVDDLVAAGTPEPEARHIARRRLGNYSLQKENTRDMNVAAWLDSLRADLTYGLRQLKSSPGFAAVAILSLALGIGANTAIFQLVNAIRLKSLPVQNPQELALIDFEDGSTRPGSWDHDAVASSAEWEQIRSQQQAFSGIMAWNSGRFNLANGGEPRYAEGLYVSGDFFRVLGVNTVLGRTLTVQDDTKACNAGAVLSYPFWQKEFNGDPAVLGRSVSLDGFPVPVIGVTPPSFFGVIVGTQFDIAVPLCADALMDPDHTGRAANLTGFWLSIMGRLNPGWTVKRAIAHLHTISPGVMQATLPPTYTPSLAKSYLANKLTALEGGTGLSDLRNEYERPLWLLMATTALVLLIACANLANLLLARATVREPEIAVRLALGASRGRLIRQLLAESLLLAIGGTAAGIVLAMLLSKSLIAFISPAGKPVFVDTHPDAQVLIYSALLAILTCILFGLAPAMRSSHLSPAAAMRSEGRSVTTGREHFGLRRILVVTQVALSLVLLFGALLFVRSFRNLLATDPGFQAEGLLSVNVDFTKANYIVERRPAFNRDLINRFSTLPGALSASQVAFPAISGWGWNNVAAPDSARAENSKNLVDFNVVSPGYFRTMETRLIAGRDFNDHDGLTSPKVAVVNQVFAHRLFGNVNPIGHSFHVAADAGQPEPSYRIVGLVINTKSRQVREDFKPIAFFDVDQDEHQGSTSSFVIRMSGSPERLMNALKTTLATVNPSIGMEFKPLSARIRESLLRESLMATLSGGFGILAASLAALGLYGVIAYMVAKRRNEIGVRIALGADRDHVIRLVLREAVVLLAIGLAGGLALSWWAGRAAATLLFGLQAHDPVSLIEAGAMLAVTVLIAGYFPARRAAVVDPATMLR